MGIETFISRYLSKDISELPDHPNNEHLQSLKDVIRSCYHEPRLPRLNDLLVRYVTLSLLLRNSAELQCPRLSACFSKAFTFESTYLRPFETDVGFCPDMTVCSNRVGDPHTRNKAPGFDEHEKLRCDWESPRTIMNIKVEGVHHVEICETDTFEFLDRSAPTFLFRSKPSKRAGVWCAKCTTKKLEDNNGIWRGKLCNLFYPRFAQIY